MSSRAPLSQLRLSLAESAVAIAREIEAGRALAPFSEKLAQLRLPEPVLPVRCAILATKPEALHAFLAAVVGHDYKVCKVVVPSRLGYSEISLQERGFILDSGAGTREFADLDSFVDALGAAHALPGVEGDSCEPLRFKLMGPAQLSGLSLLIPHSFDALLRKPALVSSLADQADWVFLAGAPEDAVSADQRQAAQLILDQVTGLQLVQVPPAGSSMTPASASSSASETWSNGWRVTLSLGQVRLGGELLPKRLELLTAPDSELRQYLVETRLWRQLDATLLLMEEELAQAQRSLGNRLHLGREGLLPDASGAGADLRKVGETIRSRLNEESESLLKLAEREARSALTPDGVASIRLREAAQALGVDDIEQTVGEVAIKLTLPDKLTRSLGDLVAQIAGQRLSNDLRQLREGFECSVRDAEAALEKATGLRHRLSWELPDETALAATLVSSRPELRYRGEMPRATLATRLGSARSMVMGLMIAGTLVGGVSALTGDSSPGAGGGARTFFAAIMLPLLIVGFLWTYVSFRKKERLTLEKEVEKLHDGVATELRRLLQETFRDQQAALSAALQRAQRAVITQMEAALEKTTQLRQREMDEARRRQQEQQRTAESHVARLRQFSQQLAALRPRIAEARKLQQQWLATWIERFNSGKA